MEQTTKRLLESTIDDHATYATDDQPIEKRARLIQGPNVRQCHFYKLAREIRDLIYHQLWNDAPPIIIDYGEYVRSVEYFQIDPNNVPVGTCGPSSQTLSILYNGKNEGERNSLTCDRLPKWLLADKTILQEEIEQLRRRAVWSFKFFAVANDNSIYGLFGYGGLLKPSQAQAACVQVEEFGPQEFDILYQELRGLTGLSHLELVIDLWVSVPWLSFVQTVAEGFDINSDRLNGLCHGFDHLEDITIRVIVEDMDCEKYGEFATVGVFVQIAEQISDVVGPALGTETSIDMRTNACLNPQDDKPECLRVTFRRK
ncbi:hypothetical protein FB567DRAFT_534584 [Paraphoma chrysanthemicola]|uniref:Uncharacterized protein n=1 Tax=Paraphoma chrysanthemicola TaxID=798071 RepID=A0A8K0VV00_9PLEO|nr:hypothetical protein FB567DRAFT_534584 [Paraphoma chrysanthemicola]